MKKILSILLFSALTFCAFAQTTYVQLVQDTTNQTYRFQRVEVRQYETVSDTLVTDRFPNKWLTAAELKVYQETLIGQLDERFAELSRLRKIAKDEEDLHIGYYDQLQGAGAYLALQKSKLQAALQGDWTFVERNGVITRTRIKVTGLEFRKNESKFGTLTINDDLSVTLAGYFNFNLTLVFTAQGEFRAERNGRLYILKK
jgi:hypothetical protein